MLALAEYEAGIHEGCGLHDSVARSDPDFELKDDYCPVEADVERFMRERAEQEHEDEKDFAPGQKRKADGRRTTIRLVSPGALVAKKPRPDAKGKRE